MQVEVLIIGSGGAGLCSALSAIEHNSSVAVLSKTYPTHSQTCQAQGGINAVIETTLNDSVDKFIEDTFNASKNLADKEQVELFCKEAKSSIQWLDNIGVPFSRDANGNIAQRKFGGTKAQRTCYSSDYTGLKILHTLYDQCIKKEISFLNEFYLLDLVIENKKITGVIALDIKSSEIIEINTKTVVLASGGYAGLFSTNTTNSYASTGDALSIAIKNGIELSNLEFIQFHPTALKNKNILISESARAIGAYLVDEEMNRFIDELKPRDEVSQAIYKKIEEDKEVFLDFRHLNNEIIDETIPQEKRLINEFMGLNLHQDLIPITPSAHYTMGGIKTNKEMQTSIQNLYACGECAQSGVHGANRLGGNSLQEIISFGRIAGENAAKKANKIQYSNLCSKKIEDIEKELEKILENESEENFYKSKKELSQILFNKVGLFRDENSLNEALIFIKKLKQTEFSIKDKSKIYNKNLIEFIEFKNSLELCEAIVTSAKNRKESRGAHFRTDYPTQLDEYKKESLIYKQDETLHIKIKEIK